MCPNLRCSVSCSLGTVIACRRLQTWRHIGGGHRAWAPGGALFSFVAAACTSENAAPPEEQQLCDLPTASGGGKVLRQLLDTDQVQTTIFAESSDLVERMQEILGKENLGKPTPPTSVCSFSPNGHMGASTLRVNSPGFLRAVIRKRRAGL